MIATTMCSLPQFNNINLKIKSCVWSKAKNWSQSMSIDLLKSYLFQSGCFKFQCSDVLSIISQFTKPLRCFGHFDRQITLSLKNDSYNFDIGPNDHIYIGQQSSQQQKHLFAIVDPAGIVNNQFSSIGNKDPQIGDARQIIVYEDEVFILDRKHHAIKIFSLGGDYRRKLCMAIGNKIYISGIYIFKNELYIRYYSKTIEVYTLKGSYLRSFQSGGNLSSSFVVTEPNGDILLFDKGVSSEIIICDSRGKYSKSTYVSQEMLSVAQICVSAYNEIFICDDIGRVEVYAPPMFNTMLRSFHAVFTGDNFSLTQNMTFSLNGKLALSTSLGISFYS